MGRFSRPSSPQPEDPAEPFESASQAWFWFIQAYEARQAGARIKANVGATARPCEPVDILRTVDRLYRNRRLLADHLRVLAHYGRRQEPPDPKRQLEQRASRLWIEALDEIEVALTSKGIVRAIVGECMVAVDAERPPVSRSV